MKITNLAIRYRTSIVILTLVLVIGGLISYQTIPKEANPSIAIPNIVVTTVYPGASPDDIESLITQPVELEVQSVNGIVEIRSTSTEGVSTVVIEFDPDISIDDALQKVRDRVDIAKTEIPSEAEEPIISEIDVQEFPIMTINLAAEYSLARLKEVAEELQEELEGIPSVLEVDLIGGLEREVQVNVDLNKLQGYNLSFEDVIFTIQEENTNIPGGSVDVDKTNYLVRVNGEIKQPEEILDLVIDAPDLQPIYVRDVAEVVFGFKDRTSYSRLEIFQAEDRDGNTTPLSEEEIANLQVVSLNVKKRPGANILDTVDLIDEKLEAFVFPRGTEFVITGDVSFYVEAMVKDLENNIISGLIFVIAVLLFFLGLRNAVLVGIAIPLSMFISFILLQSLGYTLNFIILFSLIIALGMLVDNAIVIVENIYRYREQGYSRFEAARLGTAEVGGAVVASTATTVAAFAPMLFWPGIIGEFMSYLPLTLIITLTSSLFVAIIINPVITGIFVKLESEESKKPTRTARIVTAVTVAALGLILALTNINTFIVLACAIPLFYVLNRFFFKPVGDNFVQKRLPQLVEWYRGFLRGMLNRDYSKKSNYLKNSLALGCFTLGVVLAILGGVVSSSMGQTAGMILLAPGGLLAVVGLLGIILHTFESFIYVVQGFFGKAKNMILTDNRSRLLNSTMGALVLILVLFVLFPTGVEFFPTTDPNQVAITFEAPLGTNVDASNQIAKQAQKRIDDLLNENPNARSNVKNVLANVGIGGDAMFGGGSASPEVSRVTLNLIDYEDRATPSPQTMDALREQLKGIPGTEVTFTQDQSGPPTADPVNIEVTGEDFGEIVRITRDIKSILTEASESGKIAGLVDVTDNLNTGRPELNVKIDRVRAAQFGLSTSQIATTVRSAINGTEAGTLRDGDEEYDITVRLSEEDRASLESIRSLTIPYEGEQIPLVSVAETEVSGGFGSVTRLDLSRVATVTGKAATGYNGNEILAQVVQELAPYQETIPEGYQLNFTGESEEQQESFGFLTYVLLIGVSLIFMIMVAQFNSISTPFIIMVAVGLGLIGVLLGLVITRTEFGLMTFIGIISLAGIVVNNNIVLIDYIEQLRRKGLSKLDAVIEGGATRLRPVVLTALTTVLGLIPLTFGINIDFVGLLTDLDANFRIGSQNTQFWGPMGTAIISGLTFATFLTLVIVPVMYSVFDSLGKHLGILFKGPKAEEDSQISPQEGDGFTEEVDNLAPKYATDTK